MMKNRIRKTTIWLLIVCTIIGFMPAFGSAAAAEEKTIQALETNAAVPASELPAVIFGAQQSAMEAEGAGSGGVGAVLLNSLKTLGEALRSLSADDILKLPANIMDDVVTYILAVLKALGVDIDALYAKISTLF